MLSGSGAIRRQGFRAVASAAAEELDVARDDFDHAAVRTFSILERSLLKPAFDVDRIPLPNVRAGELRERIPTDDREVLRLLRTVHGPIGRETQIRDSLAACRVAQLGVSRGVADNDDFIDSSQLISPRFLLLSYTIS